MSSSTPSSNRPFQSRRPWQPDRIHAMAIYCSDGRWGSAFDEFLQEGLKLPRYDRFAVPGGPVWLTVRHISLLPAHAAARDQLTFLVEAHELERIILIQHYGCAFYAELTGQDPETALAAQLEDLRASSATLHSWCPGVEVTGYLARVEDGAPTFTPMPVE